MFCLTKCSRILVPLLQCSKLLFLNYHIVSKAAPIPAITSDFQPAGRRIGGLRKRTNEHASYLLRRLQALGFIRLYCALQLVHFFFFFFYKLKVCGNAVLRKSVNVIFPIAFAHFVIFLKFSKYLNFSIIMFVMVMFD